MCNRVLVFVNMYQGGLSVTSLLFALMLSLLPLASFAQYSKVFDFESTTSGSGPEGSFLYDGTFLYGTTRWGGLNDLGTVFKIKPDGTGYTRLLDFDGSTNGRGAINSLISDGIFLYGMTSLGGTNDQGVIFKIKPDGTGYAKLLDFANLTTGYYAESTLFYDGTFLYGTAILGGSNGGGTLFKIKTDGTGYFTLLNFEGTVNGSNPYSSIITDGTFLYGTTRHGGANDLGTIFKIKPDGSGYINLLSFSGVANGGEPYGDLFYDGTFLYGTTLSGGSNSNGTLFKIKPDGTGYSKLLDFSATTSGESPTGSLISDGTFLYGITSAGGASGLGTIFKIKTDGTSFSKLTDFNGTNGREPLGSLISDGAFLYGMTSAGGTSGWGTFFKYSLASTSDPVIIINPQPTSTAVCEGAMATFTLSASSTTNLTYQWQKLNGTAFVNVVNTGGYSGTTTSTLTVNTAGNFGAGDYRCSVSGDLATSVFSQTASLTFTANTTLAEITANGNILTSSPGDSYQWYQNGEEVDGETNQSFEFTVLEYGVYVVDVTDNGCTSSSDEFTYLITGVEQNREGLKVYPNPVEENLFIEFKTPYTIQVMGLTGNVIQNLHVQSIPSLVDFSSMAKGIYFLKIKNEYQTQYLRIIKK